MPPLVLVVDDDHAVRASLALLLKQAGYRTAPASRPDEALAVLAREPVDLVLLDMNFSRATSGEEGLGLLASIRSAQARIPVILMTAWGSIELAVRGMRAGASDFVTKPWVQSQLLSSVETALGLAARPPAAGGEPPSRASLETELDLAPLVGDHPRIRRVLAVIGRVSATDASVLITGESGTGKELVAEAIHRNSRRRKGPFVKVNLGGVPASLFESEMFGHARGAFTDARQDRKGRFEIADGGTIFLDEIGELDLGGQVKLLRVLQDRTYEVLGRSEPRTVDVRVVSATNRNLADGVADGSFREDLLYRLNLISIHVPPLRERREDIPLLAGHFLSALARVYGREGLAIAPAALRWLAERPWPGNVRQLKHLIERAVLLAAHDVLGVADFESTEAMERGEEARPAALPEVGTMTLDEMERAMILKSIAHHGGNISRIAESLGMSRAALYRRLEKYGIQV